MTRREFPGFWYGEALPSGEVAAMRPAERDGAGRVLVPGVVQTHGGLIAFDQDDDPLYLRCTNVGGFRFAGQSHGGRGTLEWDGAWRIAGSSFSVNPHVYLPDGQLLIATASHQGYRFVGDDGRVWTGDETYVDPVRQLGEWSWHGGIVVGFHAFSLELQFGGKRYVVARGALGPNSVRFNRQGTRCALFWHEPQQRRSVALWFDEAEIAQFEEAGPDPIPDQTPDPVVAIGRPLWVGWFEAAEPTALPPGNCLLRTGTEVGTLRAFDGRLIGQWVQGGTVTAIEAQAAGPVPIVAYWDAREWPRWPTLRPQDWIALQAYCRTDETPAAFEAAMRAVIAGVPAGHPIALICQCYTSNASLTANLAGLVPVYARLARDYPRVTLLIAFSDAGRATGLNDHPELRAPWAALAASVSEPASGPTMSAPDFTITADIGGASVSFPLQATVPTAIRCEYVDQGGGAPEWIDWLYSIVGPGGPWTLYVRNPGWDSDHTYRFTTPDTRWLKARAGNAGGTHETAAERKVVAMSNVPQPDPEPEPEPEPQPPPAGAKVLVGARYGGLLAVQYIDGEPFVAAGATGQPMEVVDAGGGYVGLRFSTGFAADEDDGRLKANRSAIGDWEKFTQQPSRYPGHVGFLGRRGRYVSACGDGLATTSAPQLSDCESFTLEEYKGGGAGVEGRLTADGRIFRVNGQAWRHKGISGFALGHQFQQGKDTTAYLEAFEPLGANVARVWPYVPWETGGWDMLQDHEAVLAHLRWMRARGWRVMLTLLTDDNPSRIPQARGLVEFLAAQALDNLSLEVGNEPNTNKHIDTRALRAVCEASGYLVSSGDYDEREPEWFGSFGTDHSARDGDWPRKAHNLLEFYEGNGPDIAHPPYRVPWIEDEPMRPDQAGYAPDDYRAYAGTSALLGAGATFHFKQGDYVDCTPPDDATRRCAEAFFAGLNAFPADAPNGGYRRPVEDSLRTYVVGNYMVRVRPGSPHAPESGWQPLDDRGILWMR